MGRKNALGPVEYRRKRRRAAGLYWMISQFTEMVVVAALPAGP
jgi:hypothetical protein